MSVKQSSYQALASCIAKEANLEVEEILPLLETPKNRQFGDIAFPCFILAKQLKKSPPVCAEDLAKSLQLPEIFETVSNTGPFLNFKLKRAEICCKVLNSNAYSQQAIASELKDEKKKVIIEYSSPNIAKPFHVGHLRATLIGNCLDRIYRFLGHEVVSINHLGDWGTQFGFVWAGCELWGKPTDSSVLGLLETYRKATSLKQEQEEAKVESENSPDINKMARQFFIDLESNESYAIDFWKWCSEISLNYFQETYKRLNVAFDHYTGESFYSDMLDDVHSWLQAGGILSESESAQGVELEELGFARVSTPDGRSLYLTRDIATARYRAKTFAFDKAIYVVGAPQTLHFQQLKAILKLMGEDYAENISHVPFGHVMGIKTRGEGEFFELNDFLDEAYQRALSSYREQVGKRPEGLDETEVARAVGLSAIVFGNLAKTNIKDVHFDWDSALALQGDSGPYILYSYARITGIRQRAEAAGVALHSNEIAPAAFDSDAAFFLAEQIDDFAHALRQTAEHNEPAHFASYSLELAKRIAKAYLELKVVGEDPKIATARLMLFTKAQDVLGDCIELLGMSRLQRM